jgi:hypothetical protein
MTDKREQVEREFGIPEDATPTEVEDGLEQIIYALIKTRDERDAAVRELETERMRLAACGVAALGYFNGCEDAYKSASLDDVLALRAERDAAVQDATRQLDLRYAANRELVALQRDVRAALTAALSALEVQP